MIISSIKYVFILLFFLQFPHNAEDVVNDFMKQKTNKEIVNNDVLLQAYRFNGFKEISPYDDLSFDMYQVILMIYGSFSYQLC